MTLSIHEHQWVYLGDLALIVRKGETDVSLRRSEYCTECSTLRVQFSSGWYVMQGEASKKFLEQFDDDTPGKVYKIPPVGFRPRPPKVEPARLGRTLKDLSTRTTTFSPFEKKRR